MTFETVVYMYNCKHLLPNNNKMYISKTVKGNYHKFITKNEFTVLGIHLAFDLFYGHTKCINKKSI